MENEIQQEILKRVDLLASKIGETGGDLFASYVTWVQVEPWCYFLGAIIPLAFVIAGCLLFLKGTRLNTKEREQTGRKYPSEGDSYVIPGIIIGVISAFVFVLLMGFFISKIPNIYAPKKAAFQEFTKDLRRPCP